MASTDQHLWASEWNELEEVTRGLSGCLTSIRYSEDPTEDTKWSLRGIQIPSVFQCGGLHAVFCAGVCYRVWSTLHFMMLVKWFLPTRLETRTKESNICASH